jgi:hypothetical protein
MPPKRSASQLARERIRAIIDQSKRFRGSLKPNPYYHAQPDYDEDESEELRRIEEEEQKSKFVIDSSESEEENSEESESEEGEIEEEEGEEEESEDEPELEEDEEEGNDESHDEAEEIDEEEDEELEEGEIEEGEIEEQYEEENDIEAQRLQGLQKKLHEIQLKVEAEAKDIETQESKVAITGDISKENQEFAAKLAQIGQKSEEAKSEEVKQ